MTEETLWFDKVESFDIDLSTRKVKKVQLVGTFTKSELLKIIEVMKDD